MNIKNRLKKMERELIRDDRKQIVCAFSKTTDEQLHRLSELHKCKREVEAEAYTQSSIDGGFLSYRVMG